MTARIVDGLLFGADKTVARWVQRECGEDAKVEVPCTAIGIVKGDGLAAGIVYYNQRDNDLQCAVACRDVRAALPSVFRRCIGYAFDTFRITRITAEIELKNKRSARLAEGLGFVREGVKRCAAADGGHVAVYGLLKKDFVFGRRGK